MGGLQVRRIDRALPKPGARNLHALAELYQISSEELLTAEQRQGPNPILRSNVTWLAIVLQVGFLGSCTQSVYMFRNYPGDDFGAFIFSLVLLVLSSTWMATNHRFEPDKEQRRKNARMELGYCSIQALAALLTTHFGMGLVGLALMLGVCLIYVLYINPKFMNRKFTR